MSNAALWALAGLAVGIILGSLGERRRWRANAQTYIRLESGGRLYKVFELNGLKPKQPWRGDQTESGQPYDWGEYE